MADDAIIDMFNAAYYFAIFSFTCLILIYIFGTKRNKKTVIILFTRYPRPGKAKTRLIPYLGAEGASTAQVLMTEHILKVLQSFCKTRADTNVVIQYNGGTSSEMRFWLDRKLHSLPCSLSPQKGNSLGDKLVSAIHDGFKAGHENVVVIGGDIPGIKSDILTEAVEALYKTDVAIGKSEDGGYYLIGITKNGSKCVGRLFEGINWGTDTVYEEQVKVAKDLRLTVTTLPQVLQDVDTEEDISVFEKEVGVSRQLLTSPKWSIVIPVINEEKNIITTLETILNNISNKSRICDIVLCDGGSSDSTCDVATKFVQSSSVIMKIAQTKKGRGYQLAEGAKLACGDYLLFVHADTLLPHNFDIAAMECLQTPGNVAGAFRFQLDITRDTELSKQESWFFVQQMKFLEKMVLWRNQNREMPYGDQGLFMSRKTYNEVGGYPYYRLMEDYVMVMKLHTIGHVVVCKGHYAVTSYRRWQKYGFIGTTGFNQVILIAYQLGVHPNDLATWYYGNKVKFD